MFSMLVEMVVDTFAHDVTTEDEVVTIAIVDKDGVHYMK